jgi:hypothetical protein
MFAVILVIVGGYGFSCMMPLIIENQSNQVLTVYHDGFILGNVNPGDSITDNTSDAKGRYLITALNAEGEVVFAKRLLLSNTNIEERVIKAVIPSDTPRRGASSIDLIIENKSDMFLSILVEQKPVGNISPGESITESGLPHPCLPEYEEIYYHIAANNAQGQKVFGENLDLSELQIMDYKTLKAVIEPYYKEITFQNNRNGVVIVFVNFYRVGEIEPSETIKQNIPLYSDLVNITAEDAQGKHVYHSTYNYVSWEFRDKDWKVVIPPLNN